MKKVFALLWFSIVIVTSVCCVLIYSDVSGGSNVNVINTTQAVTSTLYSVSDSGSYEKPTLPTVEPILRPSRSGGATDNRMAALEEPSGSGTYISSSEASEQYKDETEDTGKITEYVFPEEMYPYRAMLTADQQSAYDRIYTSAMMCVQECRLYEGVSKDGIGDVMLAIYNDHPELFWISKKYSYKYSDSGRVISVKINFNETINDLNKALNNFNREANAIIEEASRLEGDEAKERYVYNAIIDSVEPVKEAQLNQSAYSAIVNKESVCAGYSRAFQYIMQKLDIPCYFCSGYANGGNHAWNIVKIDGEYYNVDISWDDELGMKDDGTYRYYNVKDDRFSLRHTRRDLSILLPKCE